MHFKPGMSKTECLIVTPKPTTTLIPTSATTCPPCQLLGPKPHVTASPLPFILHMECVCNSCQLLFQTQPECEVTSAVTSPVQTTILSHWNFQNVPLMISHLCP